MLNGFAIKVENLTKTYRLYNSSLDRLKESLHPLRRKYHREFNALHDISFEINKGDAVGVIGRNGSGKSTLLKLITGVLTPTAGSVCVNGKISALLELGSGFNPELTGIENIYFNGTLMGYSRDEMNTCLDDILSFADIGDFVYQPVKTYSSGMFVRLAFAVAINVDPDILIVDEALSVGDIKYQRKCYSKIESFRENKKTILFVSHDTGMISNVCNKAILLDSGKLISNDEPRIVSKLYVQLMYGENIDAGSDFLITDDLQAESILDSRVDNSALEGRRLIRQKALNSIGLSSKPSSSELRHGNGKGEILSFGIFDMAHNSVSSLKSGGKYIVYFYVLLYEDVQDLFFAIAIRESLGVNLFFTNNDILKKRVTGKKKGDLLLVTFDVNMSLAAGDYFLSCVVMNSYDSEYLDRRLDVFHFTVSSHNMMCKGFVNLMPTMQLQTLEYLTTSK